MHKSRTLLLAAGCTAAGALGAGAIGSSAHDGGSHQRFAFAHHHGFPALFGAVHASAVVPRSDGTFATVTFDRGTVVSVSGNELTIREGTPDKTYQTTDLNLPDGTQVFLFQAHQRSHQRHFNGNGDNAASLSDLQAGDKVAVWQSSRKTVVLATRPSSDSGGF